MLKREELYDIINMPFVNSGDLLKDIDEVLKKRMNMQESIKKLKLERR